MEDNFLAGFVPEMVAAAAIFVSIDAFAAIGAAALPVMIAGGPSRCWEGLGHDGEVSGVGIGIRRISPACVSQIEVEETQRRDAQLSIIDGFSANNKDEENVIE